MLAMAVLFGGTLAAQQPGWHKFGGARPQEAPPPLPENLTLAAGTWITIRVDEPLSSDRNHAGDAFTATLVQPLVVNGFVVARRGQTVGGRVAEAAKAGRAKGTSRLGLEINEVSLVDGQQLPVKTQLISRRGDTSVGRDVAVIGTTTGVGAAVGAAAEGGTGAGIGALAGAAASTIGVLTTRGKPTVVYPEMVLTFRVEAPLNISTERSAGAFQPVMPEDYEQQPTLYRRGPAPPQPAYFGGYPPFFLDTGVFIYSGPRFHGGGFRHW
jgi:type IV secretion system protein VirB10